MQKTVDFLSVEDFMGVDQQVDRENIGNYNQWRTQNLWEKKINVLETRGHSNLFSNNWPGNVFGLDNVVRIFKNTLDHKRIQSVWANEESPSTTILTSIPTGVAVSFVASSVDPDGNISTWNNTVNTDVGFQPYGIALRFCGYGYDKTYILNNTPGNATSIPGFSAGSSQTLQVAVSQALADANITCIEVYAIIACGGATYNSNISAIWVGSCDLISQPTGNFDFYHAPLSKRSSSSSASGSNGSLPASYTCSGANVNGGTLIPGKTYYVAVLPHYFAWSATAASCQCAYRQFGGGSAGLALGNIVNVTLQPGQNAINVNYPPSSASPISFNSMLVAVGEHPQLLIPYALSNVNPGSPNGQIIKRILSMPQNNPACVDIEYLEESNGSNICNLRFRQSDFSTGDMLSRLDNSGNKIPVFITRQSGVNRYDNASLGSSTFNVNIGSSGGTAPTIVVSPNISSAPYYTDPLVINTPVVFGGGSPPGGITFGTTYYWVSNGIQSGVSASPYGAPIAYSSTGSGVTMTFSPVFSSAQNMYQAIVNGSFVPIYTGQYYLSQPLYGQQFRFVVYQGLSYFITGIPNNLNQGGAGGYQNVPISGQNYYVTDGNIAALCVMDFSTNPQPVPFGTVIGLYQESILISGGQSCGDTVYFANATNPFKFEAPSLPGVNQFFQVEGLGEWVTGFSVFSYSMVYVSPQSFLVVTKKNSTWIQENLPTFSLTSPTFLTQISKSVGTPSGLTLTQAPIGTLFASVDNVYMVKGGGDPVPIGDPISFILKQSDLSRAVAVYHDEQFKLSFYSGLFPGVVGHNNVEFWLDIKKMKQSQGKPDWKGPMLGRYIDYCETENLTGDGTVYNQTRDRVCVDRLNGQVFKADVLPAPSDTVIYDFGVPVVSLMETKDYRVKEKDNNTNKLFDGCLWKVRTNLTGGSPLQTAVVTYVDNQQVDSQTINFSGIAATNFDDQPQVLTHEFPTSRYRGRTIRKIISTSQRIGIAGFQLFYKPERRPIAR